MASDWDGDGLRILDFDIECRPLSWYGGDFVSKEVTAIACRVIGQKKGHVWLLGYHCHHCDVLTPPGTVDMRTMLEGFIAEYDKADMVTGHYIRGFDLPVINSALSEMEMPPLSDKLSHDTKLDAVQSFGTSKSMESIGAMLGLDLKYHMSQMKWRTANRLSPDGVKETKMRVQSDVDMHILIRQRLIELHMLRPPTVWSSVGQGQLATYVP